MACITEATSGFPNANGHIPFENANIAEVLGERGWNTYIVGKWHLCAEDEMNLASLEAAVAARAWVRALVRVPRGRDEPVVPRPDPRQPPGGAARIARGGIPLPDDITDKAIEFVKDAKAIAPDKPFFLYYCPGAAHAPHHVPKEWADRYKGVFDMGYEAYREVVFERQKEMGLLPDGAELSPINPLRRTHEPRRQAVVPARRGAAVGLALRGREAAVPPDGGGVRGVLEHADHHLGRLLDYLEEAASSRTRSSFSSPTTGRQARAGRTGR